ncbi:MAG: hypothetical protein KBA02_07125 [Paludibacteraceae bacterium]|nr:hypothetical protein [Paludibacteraceae bacterium]
MNVYKVSCGFVAADRFAGAAKKMYEEDILTIDAPHYFLYQHYPINKEENKKQLQDICNKYGIIWIDSGYDRGLHNGFNHLVSVIDPKDEDVLLGIDPDDIVLTRGWDKAIVDVVSSQNSVTMACLDNYFALNHSPGCVFEDAVIAGYRVKIPTNRPTMMNASGFTARWFKQMGGFNEPTTHYGHVESHIWQQLIKHFKRYAILLDYKLENRPGQLPEQNPLYTQYKQAQASFQSRESFEEWLIKKGLGHLIGGN